MTEDKKQKTGKEIFDKAKNQLKDSSSKTSTDKEVIAEFLRISKTIVKKSGIDLINEDEAIEGKMLSVSSVWINQLKELVKKVEKMS